MLRDGVDLGEPLEGVGSNVVKEVVWGLRMDLCFLSRAS